MNAIVAGSSYLFYFSDTGGTDDYIISSCTINSMSFSGCFYLGADGNYAIHDNVINSTSNMNYLYYIKPGTDGTIEIYNEDYDLSGDAIGQYVFCAGASALTWNIHHNNINITSVVANVDIFYLRDQGQITFDNNIINTESELNSKHLNISSSGLSTGIPHIRNNVFYSKSLVQHIILIGAEDTTAGDNDFDGTVFTGNAVYGPAYFDDIVNSDIHAVFLGQNINGNFSHNYINGGGYGILFKSRSNMVFTAGGIHNNVLVNNVKYDIDVRGFQNVNIVNNTIIHSKGNLDVGINVLNEPVSGSSGANPTIKNNIIYSELDFDAIAISADVFAAGFSCDYNCIFNTQGTGFKSTVDGTTYTSLANWRTKLSDAANSINVNPKLGSQHFLRPGSACKGTGVDLDSTFENQIRPKATWPDPLLIKQSNNWNIGAVGILRSLQNRKLRLGLGLGL